MLHTNWRQLYECAFGKTPCQEENKRPLAIDIGSGCGLTAIALLLCGFDVICTDKSQVFELMSSNIENFKAKNKTMFPNMGNIEIIEFDWTTSSTSEISNLIQSKYVKTSADLIVCSDCCYDLNLMEPLVRAIKSVSLLVISITMYINHFIDISLFYSTISLYRSRQYCWSRMNCDQR